MGATALAGFWQPPSATISTSTHQSSGWRVCEQPCPCWHSPKLEPAAPWDVAHLFWQEDTSSALLTLLLDDDPEEGVGRGQGFVVVVVVVDGQEVAVDVGVAQEHVHPRDLVHCLQQLVEVLEAAGAGALHGKAAKLSVELQRRKRRKRVSLGRAGSDAGRAPHRAAPGQAEQQSPAAPRQQRQPRRARPKNKVKGAKGFFCPNTEVMGRKDGPAAEEGPSGRTSSRGRLRAAGRPFPATRALP